MSARSYALHSVCPQLSSTLFTVNVVIQKMRMEITHCPCSFPALCTNSAGGSRRSGPDCWNTGSMMVVSIAQFSFPSCVCLTSACTLLYGRPYIINCENIDSCHRRSMQYESFSFRAGFGIATTIFHAVFSVSTYTNFTNILRFFENENVKRFRQTARIFWLNLYCSKLRVTRSRTTRIVA